eukprot:CAMPEP_0168863604 /NCGR_PEP_ID=MMETSP0727-20121128/19034_1 /TAXON_ID=265536 /ORGANISM="Amphiprora sp., Strain CCMP467" /LENGTH=1102 /DNA_ID=CAMNT_0008918675 /DNA_START=25 /DNA_END=3333 /DNA_ORIENTATION=+
MGLVSTWLTGIGLSYAWPNFEAAGIVTPAALANLDVTMFASLGVTDSEHRRKLFYLVQRIKLSITEDNENQEASAVDRVLASTQHQKQLEVSSKEAQNPVVDDDDDDDDDIDIVERKRASASRSPTSKLESPRSPMDRLPQSTRTTTTTTTAPSSRTRLISSPRHETQQQKRTTTHKTMAATTRPVTTRPIDNTRPSRMAQPSAGKGRSSLQPPSASRTSGLQPKKGSRVPSFRKQKEQMEKDENVENTVQNGSLEEDDDDDDDILDDDDNDAAPESSFDDDDDGNEADHDDHNNNTKSDPTGAVGVDSIASRTRGARSRQSTTTTTTTTSTNQPQQQQQQPYQAKRKKKALSPPRRRPETAKTRLKAPTTTNNNNNPNRTTNLSQPKSNRTGKSLSTIPSDRILPMSPLMDLTTKKPPSNNNNHQNSPDHNNSNNNNNTTTDGRKTMRRKNSSNKLGAHLQPNSSDLSDSERSDRSERSSRSVSSRTSVGSKHRRKTTIRPSTKRESDRRKTLSTSNFTIMDGDDGDRPGSFKSQIELLREDNDAEHQLFTDTTTLEEEEDMRIRVVVRKRPMSTDEVVAAGDVDVIHPMDYGAHGKILVYQPRTRVDLTKQIETVPFCYDNVFGEESTNSQIYQRTVRNLIPPFFEGQWGCVFAYGQTGSGKTFTMMGSNMTTNHQQRQNMNNLGLYYMAALDVFQALNTEGFEHFSVSVSLFEIYAGKLFDLLNARNQIKCLEDHKGKVRFPGLSEHPLNSAEDLMAMIEEGSCNRSTGSTSRNADSSRSHAVLQLHLLQPSRSRVSGKKTVEFSRLTFIDLAGSERGADTSNSSKETRMEGAEINTSLLALKEVIRALATGDSMTHVPFRGSKLTQVLKESFVGTNCRSVMIACISPNIGNCEQTLNTLRYANRVKERDTETGQVSGFVQPMDRPKKTSTFSALRAVNGESNREKEHEQQPPAVESEEEEAPITPERSRQESQGPTSPDDHLSIVSSTSDMLDELLGASQDSDPVGQAAQQVILTHKDAMATLLDMVKEEMTMVNQQGNDKGMDDYIASVNALHERQLGMFALLRERIQEYRCMRGTERSPTRASGHLSDESFEDLRD